MVTLIVTTNETYLGCIMYLALQMQLFIHLPCQVSLRIRPTRGGVTLFLEQSWLTPSPAAPNAHGMTAQPQGGGLCLPPPLPHWHSWI